MDAVSYTRYEASAPLTTEYADMTSGMTPLTASSSHHDGHPSKRELDVRCLVGPAMTLELDAVAQLRGTVLQAWPDLHDGDVAVERSRVEDCAASWRGIAVLVFDDARLVGASLGLPLTDANDRLRDAFTAVGRDAGDVFLLAGSVLLPAYRGRRIGHRFFDEREAHARMLGGFESTIFATVERDADHPRRTPFARSHEAFWRRRRYARNETLTTAPTAGPGGGRPGQAVWMRALGRGF